MKLISLMFGASVLLSTAQPAAADTLYKNGFGLKTALSSNKMFMSKMTVLVVDKRRLPVAKWWMSLVYICCHPLPKVITISYKITS